MEGPIVYISTWRIRDGKFDEYARFYAELVRIVEEHEPRVAAFLAHADADLTEITNVHVYPDGATLDAHMAVLAEQLQLLPGDLTAVTQRLEPVRVMVLGSPAGAAAEMDQGMRDSGVPFTVRERYLGGFARSG
jgi:hypothetical protein